MSEKAKWTPSPRTVRYVAGMDGYQVWGARSWVGDFSKKEEAELCAAAPAMAEALEGILEADNRLHTALAGMPGDPKDYADYVAAQANHELALRACRAALALAHGEPK